jgi:uncharacterized protein (UPF0276 family)
MPPTDAQTHSPVKTGPTAGALCAADIAGAGIGLRSQHYQDILTTRPQIPWFEALTENYLGGGSPLANLLQIRERYPLTLHGVGMSLGSTDALNEDYLTKLKTLVERIEPAWVSDHLAWISADHRYVHDLLPLPYTEEALQHVSARVQQAQDFLGRRLLIENPSSYLSFKHDEITEWEFLAALAEEADCDLLFDVNNAYVSAKNRGADPIVYIEALPAQRVQEIHLAGYEEHDGYLFDTHGYQVQPPVWTLYRATIEKFGPVPTLIEWDTDIPSLEVLCSEAATAQAELEQVA